MQGDPDLSTNAQDFRKNLLQWYEKNKRDLPWRRTADPYAVWISETMLQQTQVATVIPYFARWMERFPTIAALADAPLDDVLQAWQGLGYYSRARNLHRAAQQIAETHGGVFPDSFTDVLALPGVGRYTAGAVCSIAGGRDTPIVDANVVRVLCRVFGILGDPKATDTQAALWKLATDLLPPGNAGTFNQAMMELGALVCGSPPKCERCPVQKACYAYSTGAQSTLPQFAPKPVFTTETHVCAVVEDGGRLCLRQRSLDAGLWAGLWELPRVVALPDEAVEAAAVRAATEAGFYEAQASGNGTIARVRHGVTTRKITLLAMPVVAMPSATPLGTVWTTPTDALETLALPSPQRRLLEQIGAARQSAAAQPTLF